MMVAFSKKEGCLDMSTVYRNILLPVDGSQQSIDAFKSGVLLAKKLESNVYLVLVLDENSDEIVVNKREAFLGSLADFSSKEGVKLHKEIIYGEPRSQIANDLIDRWSINLIVMGATGKGRIAKMTIGSVTEYVLRNAKCAVLISR